MSRRTRSQQQRRRAPRQQRTPAAAPAPAPKRTRETADPLAFYRSVAAPSLRMRLVLVAGLVFYVAAQVTALTSSKSLAVAGDLALFGMLGILVFLGSGFVRHQRALFRIRRENPDAWQNSMRFALSTLPIPLGFGGRPADSRERNIRRVTLLLLLAFAITAVASSSKR